jgi:glyoxylase-like metal-dependent hydrolase (beta-lactamase superfamily II)
MLKAIQTTSTVNTDRDKCLEHLIFFKKEANVKIPMEITSEIFQVGGEGFTSSQDAAIYLLNIKGKAALIDAGCGFEKERLIENILTSGTELNQVQLLLLTHCHFDHVGGAKTLKARLGCKIIAHELDAVYIGQGDNTVTAATWYNTTLEPTRVDRLLKKGREAVNIGGRTIEAIHIPGHSPGSVAYLIESDGKRVLFGQDVHGPLHPSLKSNESDYNRSLKTLIALEADILCEGHYGVIKGKKRIIDFIKSYLHDGE